MFIFSQMQMKLDYECQLAAEVAFGLNVFVCY